MTRRAQFLWGFIGSLAVEIVALNSFFNLEQSVPSVYYSVIFWGARLALACLAGGIVVAYDIQKPSLALLVGGIASLIIKGPV